MIKKKKTGKYLLFRDKKKVQKKTCYAHNHQNLQLKTSITNQGIPIQTINIKKALK